MEAAEKLNQKYYPNPNFISREIHDEYLLIPLKKRVDDFNSIYTLNELGAFIWKNLSPDKELKIIKQMIIEEFEVSSQTAENDLLIFIDELLNIGAVKNG